MKMKNTSARVLGLLRRMSRLAERSRESPATPAAWEKRLAKSRRIHAEVRRAIREER